MTTDVQTFMSTTFALTVPITLSTPSIVHFSCAALPRTASNANLFVARVVLNALQVGKLTTQ